MKLTKPEVFHMLRLIEDNEREGDYYGPREQYSIRSERIKAKLQNLPPPPKRWIPTNDTTNF